VGKCYGTILKHQRDNFSFAAGDCGQIQEMHCRSRRAIQPRGD
jgi:hypothetical protein